MLYLAGEDRAGDLVGELAAHGIAAEMRVVYRAVTVPFPDELVAALEAGDVDAVLHFSRRSAENYLAGAVEADVAEQALGAALLPVGAGGRAAAGRRRQRVAVAPRPKRRR